MCKPQNSLKMLLPRLLEKQLSTKRPDGNFQLAVEIKVANTRAVYVIKVPTLGKDRLMSRRELIVAEWVSEVT